MSYTPSFERTVDKNWLVAETFVRTLDELLKADERQEARAVNIGVDISKIGHDSHLAIVQKREHSGAKNLEDYVLLQGVVEEVKDPNKQLRTSNFFSGVKDVRIMLNGTAYLVAFTAPIYDQTGRVGGGFETAKGIADWLLVTAVRAIALGKEAYSVHDKAGLLLRRESPVNFTAETGFVGVPAPWDAQPSSLNSTRSGLPIMVFKDNTPLNTMYLLSEKGHERLLGALKNALGPLGELPKLSDSRAYRPLSQG